jgi:hypothetical protein
VGETGTRSADWINLNGAPATETSRRRTKQSLEATRRNSAITSAAMAEISRRSDNGTEKKIRSNTEVATCEILTGL